MASPDKEAIQKIFDGIAVRYDRINTLLSFRLDGVWRRKACRLILEGGERSILDLGVGTGKFLKEFLKKKSWEKAVGVDFSRQMLMRAEKGVLAGCDLVQADIHDLPFENGSFDLVVSSFTLRSVKDREHFFREVRRILSSHGKAAFLCLTRPSSIWGWILYAPYLRFYLPFIGGFFSKNREAYRFLSESIQTFPVPQEIGSQLETLGFRHVSIFPFTFGISTLMLARK